MSALTHTHIHKHTHNILKNAFCLSPNVPRCPRQISNNADATRPKSPRPPRPGDGTHQEHSHFRLLHPKRQSPQLYAGEKAGRHPTHGPVRRGGGIVGRRGVVPIPRARPISTWRGVGRRAGRGATGTVRRASAWGRAVARGAGRPARDSRVRSAAIQGVGLSTGDWDGESSESCRLVSAEKNNQSKCIEMGRPARPCDAWHRARWPNGVRGSIAAPDRPRREGELSGGARGSVKLLVCTS